MAAFSFFSHFLDDLFICFAANLRLIISSSSDILLPMMHDVFGLELFVSKARGNSKRQLGELPNRTLASTIRGQHNINLNSIAGYLHTYQQLVGLYIYIYIYYYELVYI